jgi:A/G-specific adenine glycosylase
MLQQTRIEAVVPYYQAFLDELPDIKSLAEVEEGRLLKLWEGLGYYSRARNLKRAAIEVMNHYGGKLPDDEKLLKKLSGIGDYTAGAIASVAFGLPCPAVDGNVLRVLSRAFAFRDNIDEERVKREVRERLASVYPVGEDAGNLTEGLMELGERVCLPNGRPACEQCPIALHCRAYRNGEMEQLPVRSPKKARRIEQRTVFILHCNQGYAVRRRPPKGLLAGMWELPNEGGTLTPEEAVALLQKWGMNVLSCLPCGESEHIFTHIEWHMTGFRAEVENPSESFTWLNQDVIKSQCAIPSAFVYYSKKLS